jgi:DNA methyltransferase 1-associated protein 1
MADVKDILGVARGGLAGPLQDEERPREKREKVKRPQGMSREAFALLDSSHPVAPSQLVETFKKKKDAKPKASTKGTVTFQRKAFTNPARSDKLELYHWVKGYKDVTGRVRDADEGEYAFAKYNKKVGRRAARARPPPPCSWPPRGGPCRPGLGSPRGPG